MPVKITCTRCGQKFSTAAPVGDHQCNPSVLYWWPREHPFAFAWIGWIAGFLVGAFFL